jgi:hypothetical protein
MSSKPLPVSLGAIASADIILNWTDNRLLPCTLPPRRASCLQALSSPNPCPSRKGKSTSCALCLKTRPSPFSMSTGQRDWHNLIKAFGQHCFSPHAKPDFASTTKRPMHQNDGVSPITPFLCLNLFCLCRRHFKSLQPTGCNTFSIAPQTVPRCPQGYSVIKALFFPRCPQGRQLPPTYRLRS